MRWEKVTDSIEPQWTFFGPGQPRLGDDGEEQGEEGLALPELLESLDDEDELDMMCEMSLRKEKFMTRLKKMEEEDLNKTFWIK